MGVKLVSFGFAGQGRAIMRGPMVSGVINQLLTTTEWYTFLKGIKKICLSENREKNMLYWLNKPGHFVGVHIVFICNVNILIFIQVYLSTSESILK